MRLQVIATVLLLVMGAIFAVMNRGLVLEIRTVRIPWGSYTGPMVVLLLAFAGAGLLVLLLAGVADAALANRAQRLVAARLVQRERELAEMKSRAYDDVGQKVETLREDLTKQIARLGQTIEEKSTTPNRAGV